MRWAEDRMRREEEVKALAEKYASVATAVENLEKAEQNLELVMALAKVYA
jgi:hypothetical protein